MFEGNTTEWVPQWLENCLSDLTQHAEAAAAQLECLESENGDLSFRNTISLTLFDPITPSGAQAVMEWVRLHHESVTGRDGYSDFYKKDLTFNVLGPVGDIVSEWIIKGALITEASFGDYNWDNENAAQELSLTVQPDYCILNF